MSPTRRLAIAAGVSWSVNLVAGSGMGEVKKGTRMPTGGPNLLAAPIELAGSWGQMIPQSAEDVMEYARRACLEGVRLVSDRQPARLRVDEHRSGPPAIWLHEDPPTTAWIVLDIGDRAWSQLAYQFGHELGHVLANSWQADARPHPPCQWLEEAMVEAFSLHGLGNLTRRWREAPPFPNNNAYGDAISKYRQNVIDHYQRLGQDQGGIQNFGAWFKRQQSTIEAENGLLPFAQAAVIPVLAQYEREPGCLEGLGALNRWPGRSALPIAEYLHAWRESCAELHASDALPRRLADALLS